MATATKSQTVRVKTKLRPLDNRVVIKRVVAEEQTRGGIVLPENAKKKANRGFVEAVGDGKILDDGSRGPMQVKAGDEVLFTEYAGDEIKLDEEDRLIIRESDILAVIE